MDRRRAPSPPRRGGYRDPRGGNPFADDPDEYEGGGGSFRRRRSLSPAYDRYRGPGGRGGCPPPPPKRGRRDEPHFGRK